MLLEAGFLITIFSSDYLSTALSVPVVKELVLLLLFSFCSSTLTSHSFNQKNSPSCYVVIYIYFFLFFSFFFELGSTGKMLLVGSSKFSRPIGR